MDNPVFDAPFYQAVLLDRVTAERQAHPEQVPAVLLSLADGAQLDLCHITRLADTWLAVACLRDRATCDDRDQIFPPYRVVLRVTLSMHHPQTHRLGFDVAKRGEPSILRLARSPARLPPWLPRLLRNRGE